MQDSDIRIVRLGPMRVAYAKGFGTSPEAEAWNKLLSWAKEKGMLDDTEDFRLFGFNNPEPTPDKPEYGYEQWITVEVDVEPGGDVQIKDFPGGQYAVLRTKLSSITDSWKSMAEWIKNSEYDFGPYQYLEECLGVTGFEGGGPDLETEFDIYMPIKEK
ncbi:GyrI-like domain-containing protein [bacterium]|nr:GyrI-like domain-containing protein [bacterium]